MSCSVQLHERLPLMAPTITLTSAQLAEWLRRAETAHAAYEQSLGHHDTDWADWYAAYIVAQNESAPDTIISQSGDGQPAES